MPPPRPLRQRDLGSSPPEGMRFPLRESSASARLRLLQRETARRCGQDGKKGLRNNNVNDACTDMNLRNESGQKDGWDRRER